MIISLLFLIFSSSLTLEFLSILIGDDLECLPKNVVS
jgi:hypothetical protein